MTHYTRTDEYLSPFCGTYQHKAKALSGNWINGHMGRFSIILPRNEHERSYGLIMVFADGKESTITAQAVADAITRGAYERIPTPAPEDDVDTAVFDAVMWGWLTPRHVAIADRERRTGDIPIA
jgi:hypothetical protein